MDSREVIISASNDCSIRMWTVAGLFIGIFGQNVPWLNMMASPDDQVDGKSDVKADTADVEGQGEVQKASDSGDGSTDLVARTPSRPTRANRIRPQDRRMPPDVRRVASATTLKVNN